MNSRVIIEQLTCRGAFAGGSESRKCFSQSRLRSNAIP